MNYHKSNVLEWIIWLLKVSFWDKSDVIKYQYSSYQKRLWLFLIKIYLSAYTFNSKTKSKEHTREKKETTQSIDILCLTWRFTVGSGATLSNAMLTLAIVSALTRLCRGESGCAEYLTLLWDCRHKFTTFISRSQCSLKMYIYIYC